MTTNQPSNHPTNQPPNHPLHLLIVTLLGLPLITPLLRWTSVPCTHDGHLHYHRVAVIRHAWENGILFTRWLPDLAFGYGYPFFLYREPIPLYLTHFFHLAGLPLSAAGNLFYILCILASGWFTYLWVRDVFGARAAIVAAVAYMAAPYQLADALIRGNQVESLALALFPFLLWAGRRFVLRGTARWFLITTLGLATLSLTHNISLLLFTPTLGLYLLVIGRLHHDGWRPLLWRLALVFGLGLGLTSFYTGSALLEMDEVTLSQSTTTRNNDFRYNFTSPEEIFAPVSPEDPTLINPPLPFRVGWAPAGLALLGLISLAWQKERERRAHILLMAAGATIFLLLSLPLVQPLWEAIPLIEFVQFPWRLVGRAALPVAVLAGAAFGGVAGGRSQVAGNNPLDAARNTLHASRITLAIAVALLILETIPLLYPNFCTEKAFPTILDVHAYEHETGLVGVDPEGSYFPVTVERRPEGSPLEADYAAGRVPQRFDETVLPDGAQVRRAEYGNNRAEIEVDAPAGFQATYLTFAFPGWTATVDGERVPITPSDPDGLITFPVPAGRHTLTIDWRLTPLRTALLGASLVALVGILVVAVALRKDGWQVAGGRWQVTSGISHLPRATCYLLLATGATLLAAKLLIIDRTATPLRRPAPPPTIYAADVRAGGLQLGGYNLSRERVPAGETFDVHLAWQVEATPAAALQSNVWLVGPAGRTWSDKETYRPRLYEDAPPTPAWAPGQWAWDSREVRVLPGTPPGRYDIVLTLFALDTLQPLTLVGDDGALGPTTVIGRIEVTRPGTPPTFQPQFPLDETVSGLHLLGYNQDRADAAPGDPLLLTLFWEAPQNLQSPLSNLLTLELRDPTNTAAHQWTLPPVRTDVPPDQWQPGQRLRGQHLLRLPATLESGTYRFWLEDVPLGTLTINAPDRTFTAPDYTTPVNATFGDKAELAGYTLEPATCHSPPATCHLTLVWHALAEMPTGYRVFVHLVDDDGTIVAQSDQDPAGWTRPTTGWAPGEYVVDEHTLALPEGVPDGELHFRVGLYDPDTGTRLPTNGNDFATLDLAAP